MTDAVVDSQESCRDSGWDTLDKNLDAAMDEAAGSVDNGSDSVAIISSQGTQASVRATQLHEESQQGHSQDNGGLLSAFDAAMGTFARACMPLVAAPQTPQHAGTQKSSSLSPEDSLDKALQECASPCSNGSDESPYFVDDSLTESQRYPEHPSDVFQGALRLHTSARKGGAVINVPSSAASSASEASGELEGTSESDASSLLEEDLSDDASICSSNTVHSISSDDAIDETNTPFCKILDNMLLNLFSKGSRSEMALLQDNLQSLHNSGG